MNLAHHNISNLFWGFALGILTNIMRRKRSLKPFMVVQFKVERFFLLMFDVKSSTARYCEYVHAMTKKIQKKTKKEMLE